MEELAVHDIQRYGNDDDIRVKYIQVTLEDSCPHLSFVRFQNYYTSHVELLEIEAAPNSQSQILLSRVCLMRSPYGADDAQQWHVFKIENKDKNREKEKVIAHVWTFGLPPVKL